VSPSDPVPWTCLADVLGLDGQGLVFGDSDQADTLIARCRDADYAVARVDTTSVTDFRDAQARIAVALRLPETAGRNLDALADSLRDLARYWPEADRVALIWCHPEKLIEADAAGWFRLADVLEDGSARLWRGGTDPADRVFETLLLARGFGS
jgi:Barstar (barnase inhibitor)